MIIKEIQEKELLDFEKEVGVELVVTERPERVLKNTNRKIERYYAQFADCDVSGDGVLIGIHGNGETIDEALADYARQISGEKLVFNAYSPQRREVRVNYKLKHTK